MIDRNTNKLDCFLKVNKLDRFRKNVPRVGEMLGNLFVDVVDVGALDGDGSGLTLAPGHRDEVESVSQI